MGRRQRRRRGRRGRGRAHDDNGKSTCQHIVTLTVQDETPSTSVRVEQVANEGAKRNRQNYETDKQKAAGEAETESRRRSWRVFYDNLRVGCGKNG